MNKINKIKFYDNDNDFLKDIDLIIKHKNDICIYDLKLCNNCKNCIK